MAMSKLEVRLEAVERQLNQLAERVGDSPDSRINAWIDDIHGSFQKDAAYLKASRLGREWRNAAGTNAHTASPPDAATKNGKSRPASERKKRNKA